MRVLVDTSVWADFFNDHPSPEQHLEPAGIDLYFRAAALYRTLRRRGKTIRVEPMLRFLYGLAPE